MHNKTKWKELLEIADRSDVDLFHQLDSYLIDNIYREDELMAFAEMKIIYAFKHLEINIKRLIRYSYPDIMIKGFYKWENIMEFFRFNSIDATKLTGYKEIVELKQINNALKHSDDFSESSLKILGINGDLTYTYDTLVHFYNRIKDFPKAFLSGLALAIHNELYQFDDGETETIVAVICRKDG